MPSQPPRFPRLPSVLDGPLGPPVDVARAPRPEKAPAIPVPRRRLPEVGRFAPIPPTPKEAGEGLVVGDPDAPDRAEAAVPIGDIPVPPPAAITVGEPLAVEAALAEAYDAVLREIQAGEEGPERDVPKSSPEAAMVAIAAVLEEHDHERVLPGPSEAAPGLLPESRSTTLEIPQEIADWFASRDLDLGARTEALLRLYMREWDRQRRRKR